VNTLGCLDQRVVVVTGASEGLGVAFARAVHAAGARVVVAARRGDRVAALADEMGVDRTLGFGCDVTVAADREALVNAATQRFGVIDVLVNNAGTAVAGPAELETGEDVDRVIGVNLVAAYRLCQMVAPAMLERGNGSIVNVSSISARASFDRFGLGSYAASKAGLDGLTRELAAQWGSRGVRVNALAPGWFPGGTNGYLGNEELRTWIGHHTALGRAGKSEELAAALVFLASNSSSYVTGQVLAVDGGWTAY